MSDTKRLHEVTQELSSLDSDDILYVERNVDNSDAKIKSSNLNDTVKDSFISESEKTTIVSNDIICGGDSASANNPVIWLFSTIRDTILKYIHSMTEKTSLSDDDEFVINDSDDMNYYKRIKWSTIVDDNDLRYEKIFQTPQSEYASGAVSVPSSEADLDSMSITLTTVGTHIKVDFNVLVVSGQAGNTATFIINLDSSNVYSMSYSGIYAGHQTVLHLSYLSDTQTPGSHTIKIRSSKDGGTFDIANRNLIVQDLK